MSVPQIGKQEKYFHILVGNDLKTHLDLFLSFSESWNPRLFKHTDET